MKNKLLALVGIFEFGKSSYLLLLLLLLLLLFTSGDVRDRHVFKIKLFKNNWIASNYY